MPKVFVALSGGVDSSVAAWLLKKAGYQVIGVFMKFWHDPRFIKENTCCSSEAERRARIVAGNLKIPFLTFDFKKEFKKEIVDYYLKQTSLGLTPNPCVVCNKKIKLGMFLTKALEAGADFIATGHYAQIYAWHRTFSHQMSKSQRDLASYALVSPSPRLTRGTMPARLRKLPISPMPRFTLLKGRDKQKDQSYFLWQLSQKQLAKILFPIGNYTKAEVRKLAKKHKLPTAETKESQDLCFLSTDPNDFLKANLKLKPGRIIDNKKNVVGRHPGLAFFTIGQREGIVPCLFKEEQSKGPYYVLEKDVKKNALTVTRKEKDLFCKTLTIKNLNFISQEPIKTPFSCLAKIRYGQKQVSGKILKNKKINNFSFKFNSAQRAITSGQSIVFYKGQELLGGGVIV